MTLSSPRHTRRSPEEAAAAHRVMSARLAELDFSDAQALALFPAETFDGEDSEGVGRALAARILSHWAAQRRQTWEWIEPGRDEALRTLIAHLTPTGQEALLQSLESGEGDHAFSKCFAPADRSCLAGHLYRQRAAARLSGSGDAAPPEAHAQAAEDYQTAADAYLSAAGMARAEAGAWREKERYAQAGDDYRRAAKIYAGLGQSGPQALAWRWAARMYLRAHQPGLAYVAFEHSALAHGQAGRHGPAGDAWRSCADILTKFGTTEQARDALYHAATAYQKAAASAPTILQSPSHAPDDPEGLDALPAVSYRLLAAAYYRAAGRLEQSSDAFVKAAETLRAEDLPLEASDAFELGAQYPDAIEACKKAVSTRLAPGAAADAFWKFGFTLREAFRREARLKDGPPPDKDAPETIEAFLTAADLYERAGALEAAAEACVEAGVLKKAASLFAQARKYGWAGFCHEEIKEFDLAAMFYTVASAQATDAWERAALSRMAQECLSGHIANAPDSA